LPSLKSIRKRIASTKSTQKITRAMKMVAGARLTRAQQRIVALRPYALKTQDVLGNVARAMQQAEGEGGQPGGSASARLHPLLEVRPEKTALFVVMTSDRGLCGAFNTNITKATERAWRDRERQGNQVSFVTIGRKGREYLSRRRATILHDFQKVYEALDLDKARTVANWIVRRYLEHADAEGNFQAPEFDAVYLVYNEFKSAITQRVAVEKLLPLDPAGPQERAESDGKEAARPLFVYEPDRKALLESLVPMYVEISILRALLENQASEFGARMTAMDAATRNAKEMIARLTLSYNRARQAAITKELMEIIGGAEALKD
jgi:F-type H+-transporting ATPase subunit gamma